MCGILGWLGANVSNNLSNFNKALDLLNHRGPDDQGVWQNKDILLGHRRLSIIDLSKSGHQPMVDEQTGSVIIFNGEIYNYQELAKELIDLGHKLIGSSDTEVLLHSLIEWGPAVLPRLNGMWSFAFWCSKKNQLMLSRDRFGVKPLYINNSKNGFAFASEPKALLSLFPECRFINDNTLLDFLGNNLLYSKGESFYKNINVFPPSHYGIYDLYNKNFKLTRYWDYPKNIDHNISENEALEEFSNLFEDSVRLRLRSDVSIGITLSGGLDSTGILAAVASQKKEPINCFTSVYEEDSIDEFKWAKNAIDNTNSKLFPVVAKEDDWLKTLKNIAWHMDAPGYSPAVYPIWNLMKYSRLKGVPVLLDGQGADESLAGYPHYIINNFIDYLRGKNKKDKGFLSHIIRSVNTFGLGLSTAWMIREISPMAHSWYRKRNGFQSIMLKDINIPQNTINIKDKSYSVRDRLISDHSINILPGLLHYGDAISMSHGVEIRNPFLDYRLVEWIFKLPNHLLFNQRETKWILREYLRKNNQFTIGNRPDKKGYPTPINKWLTSSKNNDVESILLSNDNPIFQWCDKKKIKNLINKNKKGSIGAEHHLYKLLSTQLWIEECLK